MKFSDHKSPRWPAAYVLLLLSLVGAAAAQTFNYVSFLPAGATQTVPTSVSARGDVAGYYFDLKFVQRGFFRSASGAIFDVDPPGSSGTVVTAIDPQGIVSGYYQDKAASYHGFVRRSGGAYISFDAASGSTFTLALATNGTGNIVGIFF